MLDLRLQRMLEGRNRAVASPDAETAAPGPRRGSGSPTWKTAKRLCFILLLAAALYFVAFVSAVHVVGSRDTAQEADAIVVLGAGLLRDGRPGWALTRRSLHAADLWRAGIAPYIICTGGQAESFPRSEAAACRELLRGRQIPASAILVEELSRSTEENAIYSKRVMQTMNIADVVLVSDDYHMLRASWLFQMQGINAFNSPAPARRMRPPLSYPYSLMREFVAFNWQLVKGAFGIPVTHLKGV
ncbi:MAG: YdcF family protein [Chloroflexi bacterium]|nr:YdcF family protein [Chloroflexota bacterium]